MRAVRATSHSSLPSTAFCASTSPAVKPMSDVIALTTSGCAANA